MTTATAVPTSLADVLSTAADLIATRGLARRMFEAEDGALCTLGALRVAIFGNAYPDVSYYGDEPRWRLYYDAGNHVTAAIQWGKYRTLPAWSDGSTHAEVVATLHAAARVARDESVEG